MMTATYSPEDNKLRLYSTTRLAPETYARVKAAGFIWAPRQGLFVAPMWTPHREDLLLELCEEIGDEDTSLVERAEQRSKRFNEYSDNRNDDAEAARNAIAAISDNIPIGQPILVGHHSECRARKDVERIDNGMRRAVKMWETSDYWQRRAEGAIRHAKYKERPDVRARRIKGLESDKRKVEHRLAETQKFLVAWKWDGLTRERAISIANHDHITVYYTKDKYPASTYEGASSVWSGLDKGLIDEQEAARISCAAHEPYVPVAQRWLNHYENRIAYERAMLAESGGTAADRTRPEKGGACQCWVSPRGGWSYIQKVNKVSVTVLDNWRNGGANFTRTIPFDKLIAVMTAAEVQARQEAGLLLDIDDGIGFLLRQPPPSEEPGKDDSEATLRRLSDEQGVLKERQDELIADVTAKSQPGAKVGPFILNSEIEAVR